MFGLVFRKGFVGLTLACAMLAGAVPGVAKEHPGETKEHAAGPPPHAQGNPPPAADGEKPPAAASEPSPVTDASAPAASEPEPPAPRTRVMVRSVPPPGAEVAPAEDPIPADDPARRDEQPAPRRQADASPRTPATQSEPPASTFRTVVTGPPAAESPAASEVAAAASSSGSRRASRADETRSDPVAPAESLPARVVPQPVRRIVEVVPAEIWAALGGLALLAFALAASSWTTAKRARRLRRQREALLKEVGLLQTALLPSVPPSVPVSVAYRPADGATAGGDFYDAFTLAGGRTGVILGDVSGHGHDALARTTFIRYTLRAYLEAGLEPREVLKVGSAALADHLDGGFATVTVAIHEPTSGRFTYASAGHPPPIVTGSEQPFEPVTACSAPPLGIGEATGFRQSTFTLTAGSRACLYTDGVTEARVEGRLLGLARLERALEALPPGADAEKLLDAVTGIADEITDDMAVCLVAAAPDAPAAGPRIEELAVDERDVGDSLEQFLRACGVALAEVPGILREAGEATRREGFATVRVRSGDFRPGVDVVPGNLVRLSERRRAVRSI